MNFFKPKFWDKNKVSFFSVFLLPVALSIKLLFFLKYSLTRTHQFSVPVICIGNIYLGGTGKTPLCIELFSILKELNMNPAFIRKKYDSFQDEVNLQKKTGPIFQNIKRSEAIKEAIQNKSDIVILDDGFQDSSIKKNLSIICFNEKQWIGNGFSIPSGPLRENFSAIKRADFIFINGKRNTNIEKKIFHQKKDIRIFYTTYKPINLDDFKNKKVLAFAGIGNPNNFFDLLEDNKINVIEKIKFPDHYKYSYKDLKNLSDKAKNNNNILLTTEKDYLRIDENYNININYLKIKVEIENKSQFIKEVKKII